MTNRYYCQLANEKDDQKYKAGRRIKMKDSQAATKLSHAIAKYPIPSPTLQIKVAADMDYSKVPVIVRFDQEMTIASGVSAPKILTTIANNGEQFKQLVGLV